MRTIRTPKKRSTFLAAIGAGNSVSAACQAGLGRSAAYAWRDGDSDFADEWDEAVECGTERLEDGSHAPRARRRMRLISNGRAGSGA